MISPPPLFVEHLDRRCELDSQFYAIILKLELMPNGATQQFNPSAKGHPESRPLIMDQKFTPLVFEDLKSEYLVERTNLGREGLILRAEEEIDTWKSPVTDGEAPSINIEEIVIEDGEGYAAEHVAQYYKLSLNQVYNMRRRAGRRADDGRPIDPSGLSMLDRQAEVKRLMATNLSQRQIAAIVGCSVATVNGDIREIERRMR